MLPDPAEAGFLGDRFFHHRRAVDERAVTELADVRADLIGQFLQAPAHELVIVTP